jgi:hypothetical protein
MQELFLIIENLKLLKLKISQYKEYKNKYPTTKATFENDILTEAHLARFEWLIWWIDYSLKNHKTTIISNS